MNFDNGNGNKNGHVDPNPQKGNDNAHGHKGSHDKPNPPIRDKQPTPSHSLTIGPFTY